MIRSRPHPFADLFLGEPAINRFAIGGHEKKMIIERRKDFSCFILKAAGDRPP